MFLALAIDKWALLSQAIGFFVFNAKLSEMGTLASKILQQQKRLPPMGLDPYPTMLVWHVIVSLRLLDPYIVMLY